MTDATELADATDLADATELTVWRRARRELFVPVDIIVLALSVACAAGLRIPEALQYVPFALGLVIFGLPHGALDHLVPARLAGRRPTVATVAPVVGLYLVLGVAVAALWVVSPIVAFVFFIALTWFHWGQGDAFASSRRTGERLGWPRATGFPLLRGALPMVVPLIAFPATYAGVLGATTRAFGGESPSGTLAPGIRIALGVGMLVLAILVALLDAWGRRGTPGGRRAWLGDVAEVALLAFFFSTVPPVLAVGLYFALWHSVRHIVRLSLLDPALSRPLAEGRWGLVLLRFSGQAAPVTGIALLILAGLFFALTPRTSGGPLDLLGIYLVLISALTVPHAVIVAIMDHAQGRRSGRTVAPARLEASTERGT
jgi:Brp/Blh family beta-carotene 15,15'-monooxygenase